MKKLLRYGSLLSTVRRPVGGFLIENIVHLYPYLRTIQMHAGIAEVAAAKARMFVNKPDGSKSSFLFSGDSTNKHNHEKK